MNTEKDKAIADLRHLAKQARPDLARVRSRTTANSRQVGGDHYMRLDPNPWDFFDKWGLGFYDGNAVKYLTRWRHKNGIEDLEKAKHFIEKLIELETAKLTEASSAPNGRETD